MHGNQRRNPYVSDLPPGARQPTIPSPQMTHATYNFQVTPPGYQDQELSNPWETHPHPPPSQRLPSNPYFAPRQRTQSTVDHYGSRPMSTGDVYGPDTADAPIMAFPEPHVFRATSAQARSSQTPQRMVHRYSRSDLGSSRSDLQALHHNSSVVSFASSYNGQNDDYEPGSTEASLWSTIFTCSHIFV